MCPVWSGTPVAQITATIDRDMEVVMTALHESLNPSRA